MTLFKTTVLNAIAVLIRMLALFGVNKIFAIYVGPSGYAAIGQFQNFFQVVTAVAAGAVGNGVTKYTAEYKSDKNAQHKMWRTAGTASLIFAFMLGIFIVTFKNEISILILKDRKYEVAFTWGALCLIFFVFNNLILAIGNGKKEIHRYVLTNVIASILTLIVTAAISIEFGLLGALISISVCQFLALIVTLIVFFNAKWFKISNLFGKLDKESTIKLSKFLLMSVTSAIAVPLTQTAIRNHLLDVYGWVETGYVEAMWRVSSSYLIIITTTLSIYYLPRYSELKSDIEIKNEIFNGYRLIIPSCLLLGLAIYHCRDSVINLLFTNDFIDMNKLFLWQIVGDSFKILSWILSYIMLGKAMVRLYVFSEILFSFTFYLLSVVIMNVLGIEGVALAHAINYFGYLLFMIFCFKQILYLKQ